MVFWGPLGAFLEKIFSTSLEHVLKEAPEPLFGAFLEGLAFQNMSFSGVP